MILLTRVVFLKKISILNLYPCAGASDIFLGGCLAKEKSNDWVMNTGKSVPNCYEPLLLNGIDQFSNLAFVRVLRVLGKNTLVESFKQTSRRQ